MALKEEWLGSETGKLGALGSGSRSGIHVKERRSPTLSLDSADGRQPPGNGSTGSSGCFRVWTSGQREAGAHDAQEFPGDSGKEHSWSE